MILHEKVRSAEKPKELVMDEFSVWLATNVKQVEVTENREEDEEITRTEYEFDLAQYTKEEYMSKLVIKNKALEAQLTDTQLALVEIYESMGV